MNRTTKVIIGIIILGVALGLYTDSFNPKLTGFFAFEKVHMVSINQTFTSSEIIPLSLFGSVRHSSIKASRSLGGAVKVILQSDSQATVILDSSNLSYADTNLSDYCLESCFTKPFVGNLSLNISLENGSISIDSLFFRGARDNKPPHFSRISSEFLINKNTPLTLQLNEYFRDPNNDSITYLASQSSKIKSVMLGSSLTLIPTTDFIGVDNITIFASDGLETTSVYVQINVEVGSSASEIEAANSRIPIDARVFEDVGLGDEAPVIVITKRNTNVSQELESLTQKNESEFFGFSISSLYDYNVTQDYSSSPAIALSITERGLEKLKNNLNVEAIMYDELLMINLAESVPQIGADVVHKISVKSQNLTGSGISVCVIDTGIDVTNPDFNGRIVGGIDFVNNDNSPNDDHGHGTHVSGIIASSKGVAPNSNIVPIKACNSQGACLTSAVLAGIDYCTMHKQDFNITAISGSFGDGKAWTQNTCPTSLDSIFATTYNQNISLVFASGNNGYANGVNYPACSPYAIAVGAITKADTFASFSNFGDALDILAPGVSITSSWPGGSTRTLSGTSMAVPFVSGAIAVLTQLNNVIASNRHNPAGYLQDMQISAKNLSGWNRLDLNKTIVQILTAQNSEMVNKSVVNQTRNESSNNSPVVISAAPALTNVNITPHLINQTVFAKGSWNFSDADGDTENGTIYTWFVNTSEAWREKNLLAYWPLDVDFNDTIKNRIGTAAGQARLVSGIIKNASTFDGTTDGINSANNNDFTNVNVNNYSLCLWFNPQNSTSTDGRRYMFTVEGTMYISILSNETRIGAEVGAGTSLPRNGMGSLVKLPLNTWHHACVSYNSTTSKLFLDGDLQDTKENGPALIDNLNRQGWNIGHQVQIGTGSDDDFDYKGKVDEVKLWNRTLSSEEISQEYYMMNYGQTDTQIPGTPNPDIPVSIWHFDETSVNIGDAFGDHNGTGYNLLQGSPGRFGSSESTFFNGVNSYVDLDQNLFLGQNVGTIIAWVNQSSYEGNDADPIFSSSKSSEPLFSTKLFVIGINKSGNPFVNFVNAALGENNGCLAEGNISDGLWHQIAYSSNAVVWRIYIDNVEQVVTCAVGSNTGQWFNDLPADTYDTRIGRVQFNSLAGFNNFSGWIDELEIYDKVLTGKEINQSYYRNFPLFGYNTSMIMTGENLTLEITPRDNSGFGTAVNSSTKLFVASQAYPFWYDNVTNQSSIRPGDIIRFNVTWNATLGLNASRFSINQTGSWLNTSWSDLMGLSNVSSNITTISGLGIQKIQWRFYANDSSAQQNQSDIFEASLTHNPPFWYNNLTNATIIRKGDVVMFNMTWNSTIGLNASRFSINQTGNWVNASWQVLEGLNNDSSNKSQITAVYGQKVEWKFYANDSLAQNNETNVFSFTITNTIPAVSRVNVSPTSINSTVYPGGSWNYSDNDNNQENGTVYTWFVNGTEAWKDNALLNYWRLDNNGYDYFGRNNLTFQNNPNNLTNGGIIKGAYQFDGVQSYANTTVDYQMSEATFSLWFKRNSTFSSANTNTEYVWWINQDNATTSYAWIRFEPNSGNLTWDLKKFIGFGSDEMMLSTRNIWDLNRWYHLAITCNGVQRKIYVNGEIDNVQNSDRCFNDVGNGQDAFAIASGYFYVGPHQYFNGSIDEFKVWNRSLSAEEVSQEYQMMKYGQTEKSLVNGSPAPNIPIAMWNFNEGSGVQTNDYFGENNGSVIGDGSWVQGLFGSTALFFDGIDDYVHIADAPSLRPQNMMSISMWCNATASNTAQCQVLKHNTSSLSGYALFLHTDNKFYLQVGDGVGGGCGWCQSVSSDAISSPGLYFVTGVYSQNFHAIYVNGNVSGATGSGGALVQNNESLWIGRNPISLEFSSGLIDEVSLYDRVLSPEEINQSFNRRFPLFGFNTSFLSPGTNLTFEVTPNDGSEFGTAMNSSVNTLPSSQSSSLFGYNNNSNQTSIYQNDMIRFNFTWNSSIGLNASRFSINETGAWVNASWNVLQGLSNVSTNVTRISAVAGAKVQWKFYANDSQGLQNESSVFEFTVQHNPPYWYNNNTNQSSIRPGDILRFNITWNATASLNASRFSINQTGSWLNTSWTDLAGLSNVSSNITTISGLGIQKIQWRFYANDSAAQQNQSDIFEASLTHNPPFWYNNNTNATVIRRGDLVRFNTTWNSTIGLNATRFSINQSGSWVNASWTSLHGLSNTSSNLSTITAVYGQKVEWKFYANDSLAQSNETGIFSFTITNTIPVVSRVNISPTSINSTTYPGGNWNYSDNDHNPENGTIYQWYTNNSEAWRDSALVGYWRLDEDGLDSSTYGHNLSLQGEPVNFNNGGIIRGDYDLDGINDYLNGSYSTLNLTRGPVSISAWINVKTCTDQPSWAGIAGVGYAATGGTSNIQYQLFMQRVCEGIRFDISNGTVQHNTAPPVGSSNFSTNAWHHVAATWNGTKGTDNIRVFFDGGINATGNSSIDSLNSFTGGDTFFKIGVRTSISAVNGWLNGEVDEVKIWNRTLSDEEISQEYQMMKYGQTEKNPAVGTPAPDIPLAMWSLDEGSGSTTQDYFGDNSGALINSPTWTTGLWGTKALQFNGISQSVNMGNVAGFSGRLPYTVSFWMKIYGNNSYTIQTPIGRGSSTTTQREYLFYYNQITGTMNFQRRDADANPEGADVVSAGLIAYNQWYQVAGTYNGTDMVLYLNGTTLGNGTSTKLISSSDVLHIGRLVDVYDSDYYMNGTVEQVEIYNRSLSANEISQNYKRTFPPFGFNTSLLSSGTNLTFEVTPNDGSDFGTALNSSIKLIPVISSSFLFGYNNNTNQSSIRPGDILRFNITWNATASLNASRFSINQTGSWLNTSWSDLVGLSNVSSNITTISGLGIQKIQWRFYANDSAAQQNQSDIFEASLTHNPPFWYNNNTNATVIRKGDVVFFNMTWNSTLGLNASIFSINQTGSWINASWTSLQGLSNTSSNSSSITAVYGQKVEWKFYANDSLAQSNETGIFSFTITNTIPVVSRVNITPTTVTTAIYPAGTWNFSDIDNTGENGTVYTWFVNGTEAWKDGNLITYLKFDGNAIDSSNFGNDGVVSGAMSKPSEGIIRGAYGFDGDNDYVSSSDSSSLDISKKITVMAWVKPRSLLNTPDDFAQQHMGIVAKNSDSTQSYKLMFANTVDASQTALYFGLNTGGTEYGPQVGIIPQLNKWHHVAGVYNGSEIFVFYDGVVIGNQSVGDITIATNNFPLLIGWDGYSNAGRRFNGSIDEVKVLNRSLSFDEISQEYNMMKYGQTEKDSLNKTPAQDIPIASWNFNEGSRNQTNDYFGDFNGTIANASWTTGRFGSFALNLSKDTYVTMGNPAPLNLRSNFTILAWINRARSEYGSQEFIVGKDNAASRGFGLEVYHNVVSYENNGAWIITDSGVPINKSIWYQVGVSYDGTNYRTYVNGSQDSSAPGGLNPASTALFMIGAREYSNGQVFFNGSIDDIEIYNSTLSSEEINQSYVRRFPLFGYNTSLMSQGSNLTFEVTPNDGTNFGNAFNSSIINSSAIQAPVPVWYNNITNQSAIRPGDIVRFNITWNSTLGLNASRFSINQTGSWLNTTWTDLAGLSNVSSNITTISGLGIQKIQWRFYANDSAAQQNQSDIFEASITHNPPFGYNNLTNQSTIKPGDIVRFNVTWNATSGLNASRFGINQTGSWLNTSWNDLEGLSNVSSNITTITGLGIQKIQWRYYANDSSAQQNQSDIFEASLTHSVPTPYNELINKSGIRNGDHIRFNVTWSSTIGLNATRFSINQTGDWVNTSWSSLQGLSNTSSNVTVITAATGTKVQWRFYTNDSLGQQNASPIVEFEVTSISAPAWYNNNTNQTSIHQNDMIQFNLTWNSTDGLNASRFSINATGIWVNASWNVLQGISNVSSNVSIINAMAGQKVQWKFYANDSQGLQNESTTFEFTVQHNSPYWYNNNTNQSSIRPGNTVRFNITWNATSSLNASRFSINQTGSWLNTSWSDLVGLSNVTSNIITISGLGIQKIQWRFYANDSAAQQNQSDIFEASLTHNPPFWYNNNTNTTVIRKGDSILFNATWNSTFGLNASLFSINQTGSWINASWTSLQGLSNTSSNISSITAVYGQKVEWKFYANDSLAQNNETLSFSFTIANTIPIATRVNISPTTINSTAYPGGNWNYSDVDITKENGTVYTWFVNGTEAWKDVNLIGYWKLDGNALDSSGLGNDGTINSATSKPKDGIIKGAYVFDGIDDYINTLITQTKQNFTASAWINPLSTDHPLMTILSKRSFCAVSTDDFPFELYLGASGGIATCIVDSGNDYSIDLGISSMEFSPRIWRHVTCSYDSSNLSIYIDGELVNSTGGSVILSTNNRAYTIGRSSYEATPEQGCGTNQSYFNGTIDEVKLWDRPLSAREISQEFRMMNYGETEKMWNGSGSPAPDIPSALFSFNEYSGTATTDFFSDSVAFLQNGASFTSGLWGTNAVFFDGTNDVVNITNANILNVTDFSVLLWMSPRLNIIPTLDANPTILSRGSGNAIDISSNDGRIEVRGPSARPVSTTSVWNASVWYHIVITHNATEYVMYINGTKEGNSSEGYSILNNSQQILIGGSSFENVWFNGSIEDVTILDRSLNAVEVIKEYRRGFPLFGYNTSLLSNGTTLSLEISPNDGFEFGTAVNSSTITIIAIPGSPALFGYNNNSNQSNIRPGDIIRFNVTWNATAGLNASRFSINQTGSWLNASWNDLAGISNVSSNISTITGLGIQKIQWRFYANDSSAQQNQSNIFEASITHAIPTPYNQLANQSGFKNGENIRFNITWNSTIGLNATRFSINQTGDWVNTSWTSLQGLSNTSSNVTVITAATGTKVQWRFYANDSLGQQNTSPIIEFTVTSISAPAWYNNNTNQTSIHENDMVRFNLSWNSTEGLNASRFSINETGAWVNASWNVLQGISNVSSNVSIINAVAGQKVQWKFYANDSQGLQNESATFEFTVQHNQPYWYNNNSNQTSIRPGDIVRFNVTWNSTLGLNASRFSINQTGSWLNASWSDLAGLSNVSSNITTISGLGIQKIQWRFYANDSAAQQNQSDIFEASLTHNPPFWYNNNTNQSTIRPGDIIRFNITWNSTLSLNTTRFSINQTGSWLNASWNDLASLSNVTSNITTIVGLGIQKIQWRFYANDSNNQQNETNTFEASITHAIPTPINANVNQSGIRNGEGIRFNVTWNSTIGLNATRFSINQTGDWVNTSWTSLQGLSNTSSNVTVITAATGSKVQWRFYANDSLGQQNESAIVEFTVVSFAIPAWYNNNSNQTIIHPGDMVRFNITWNGTITLNASRFSLNETGEWTNASWVSLQGLSNVSSNVTRINGLGIQKIQWRFYANDSDNRQNASDIFEASLTHNVPLGYNSIFNQSSIKFGDHINFSITWNSTISLNATRFSINQTGNWVNTSWTSLQGFSNITSNTSVITAATGTKIQWRFYANDSLGQGTEGDITEMSVSTSVATCGLINSSTALSNDVASLDSTCFNISGSNVILDCQGHTIDGKNTVVTAIAAANATEFTIKNCNVVNATRSIQITGPLNDSFILNNNVTASTVLITANAGVNHNLTMINNQNISTLIANAWNTSSLSGNSIGLVSITGSYNLVFINNTFTNANVQNFSIGNGNLTSNTFSNYSLSVQAISSITNNLFVDVPNINSDLLTINLSAGGSEIKGNNFSNGGTGASCVKIEANNSMVHSNRMNNCSNSWAIYLQANNATIINNTIRSSGLGNTRGAITIGNGNNSRILENTINGSMMALQINGTYTIIANNSILGATGYGLFMNGTQGFTKILDNRFANTSIVAIQFEKTRDNSLVNNSFINILNDSVNLVDSSMNTINNTEFSNSNPIELRNVSGFGKVRIKSSFNVTTLVYLNKTFNIQNNSLTINDSLSFRFAFAEIFLNYSGSGIINPSVGVDEHGDNEYLLCNYCTILSSANSLMSFNVTMLANRTGFARYKVSRFNSVTLPSGNFSITNIRGENVSSVPTNQRIQLRLSNEKRVEVRITGFANLSFLNISSNATHTAISGWDQIANVSATHTLFVPNGNSDGGVFVCPNAVVVSDVIAGCANYTLFTGPFPQLQVVQGDNVSVSLNGSDYRIEGLTHSGVGSYSSSGGGNGGGGSGGSGGGGGGGIGGMKNKNEVLTLENKGITNYVKDEEEKSIFSKLADIIRKGSNVPIKSTKNNEILSGSTKSSETDESDTTTNEAIENTPVESHQSGVEWNIPIVGVISLPRFSSEGGVTMIISQIIGLLIIILLFVSIASKVKSIFSRERKIKTIPYPIADLSALEELVEEMKNGVSNSNDSFKVKGKVEKHRKGKVIKDNHKEQEHNKKVLKKFGKNGTIKHKHHANQKMKKSPKSL